MARPHTVCRTNRWPRKLFWVRTRPIQRGVQYAHQPPRTPVGSLVGQAQILREAQILRAARILKAIAYVGSTGSLQVILGMTSRRSTYASVRLRLCDFFLVATLQEAAVKDS